jgi:hypothetical protein
VNSTKHETSARIVPTGKGATLRHEMSNVMSNVQADNLSWPANLSLPESAESYVGHSSCTHSTFSNRTRDKRVLRSENAARSRARACPGFRVRLGQLTADRQHAGSRSVVVGAVFRVKRRLRSSVQGVRQPGIPAGSRYSTALPRLHCLDCTASTALHGTANNARYCQQRVRKLTDTEVSRGSIKPFPRS